jgi:monothiol glutaredoxin
LNLGLFEIGGVLATSQFTDRSGNDFHLPSQLATMTFNPESSLSQDEVTERVDETIENNEVVLFMKGSEMMPQCGYSRKALGLIQQYREDYETVDVLESLDEFRAALEPHSGRETIPQTFVDGEFVGGSDILEQLDERGDLEAKLEV